MSQIRISDGTDQRGDADNQADKANIRPELPRKE